MVTWGSNTTTSFTTSATPAATPSATSGFSFGGTPATPPATAAPSNLFAGSTPGATTTSFGTPTAAAAASVQATPGSAGSSLFGGTTGFSPASSFTSTTPGGGLFGSTTTSPAKQAAGGLFGAAPTASAPATGGFFGAAAARPQQQPQPVMATTQPQQAAMHAHLHAQQAQETNRIETALLRLLKSYSTINPQGQLLPTECRFQHLFYDAIDPSQRQLHPGRAVHVDPKQWAAAEAQNPDPANLIPVSVVGADALQARVAGQQQKATHLQGIISSLQSTLETLQRSNGASEMAVNHAKHEQEVLNRRMLQIMRKVEVLRCMNLPLQRGEMEWKERMEGVSRGVERVEHGLRNVIGLAERYQPEGVSNEGGGGAGGRVEQGVELSEEDKASLYQVMDEQRCGLQALTQIVTKDVRDVHILKKELGRVQ